MTAAPLGVAPAAGEAEGGASTTTAQPAELGVTILTGSAAVAGVFCRLLPGVFEARWAAPGV